MKVFKITTEVQATKTLEYTVEANSMEEAIQIVCGGEERGEGEEVEEVMEWHTETIIDEEIED
jgi:tRNA-binding EMAP/Myf-like protein